MFTTVFLTLSEFFYWNEAKTDAVHLLCSLLIKL